MTKRHDYWREMFINGLRRHSVANVISRRSKSDGKMYVILTKELPELAFGGGKRICLGRHLAMEEGRIVLEKFFQKFILEKIELPPGPLKQNIMYIDQPGPVMVTVRRR